MNSRRYSGASTRVARVRVENNVFDDVDHPHIFHDGEPTAQIVASGDLYTGTAVRQPQRRPANREGAAFDPPYDYTLPASGVEAVVKANAGPR